MAMSTQFIRQIEPLKDVARRARGLLRRASLFPQAKETEPGLKLVRSGSLVVALDDFEGEFELDGRSHLLRRVIQYGSFEPICARAAREHLQVERDAIDVGANSGFYSVLFGKRLRAGRRVLAIEPTRAAAARLERNVARNGLVERVTIIRSALGDREGEASLEVPNGLEEYSAATVIHPSARGAASQRETVPVVRLDELVRSHGIQPGFIKMDVEGAEAAVLRGSVETLNQFRPTLLLELMPRLLEAQGASLAEVLRFLDEHRYTLRWLTSVEALALPR